MSWSIASVRRDRGKILVIDATINDPSISGNVRIVIPLEALRNRLRWYGLQADYSRPPTRGEKLAALRAILREHHARLVRDATEQQTGERWTPPPGATKREKAGGLEPGIAINVPADVLPALNSELDGA